MSTLTGITNERLDQKYIVTLTNAEINWLLTLIRENFIRENKDVSHADGTVLISQRTITINNKLWKSVPQ